MGGSVSAGDDHSRAVDHRQACRSPSGKDEPPVTVMLEPAVQTPTMPPATNEPKISVRNFDFHYGDFKALHGITLDIPAKQVTAFIGPSGCGKSTFLRAINRMNDIIPEARAEGTITIDGKNIYAPGTDPVELRRRVGMVFQKSNPFP